MSSIVTAWKRAEAAVFAYLVAQTGDTDGASCAVADIPITHDFDAVSHFWEFDISGGGEPLEKDVNVDTPGECNLWVMAARVRGVWVTRAAAQDFFGKLSELLPLHDTTVVGVERLQVANMPTIEPDVWEREIAEDTVGNVEASAKGGPKRIWLLTVPLEISFTSDTT
jgi:hypothetical protein